MGGPDEDRPGGGTFLFGLLTIQRNEYAVAACVESAYTLLHPAVNGHPYLVEIGQIIQRLMQSNNQLLITAALHLLNRHINILIKLARFFALRPADNGVRKL